MLSSITRTRQSVWIASGIAGLFLVANAIVSLQSAQQVFYNDLTVDQAYRQLYAVDNIFVTLADAEAGQRGYMITGDKKYLEQYSTACIKAEKNLESLERHSGRNGFQQELVRELRSLVDEKLGNLSKAIRRQTPRNPESLDTQSEGTRLLSKIRGSIQRISENAQVQLDQSSHMLEVSEARLKTAILLGMATGILLVFGTTCAMERQHRNRVTAEAALIDSNHLSQSTLDALRSHVAILDKNGNIVATKFCLHY